MGCSRWEHISNISKAAIVFLVLFSIPFLIHPSTLLAILIKAAHRAEVAYASVLVVNIALWQTGV